MQLKNTHKVLKRIVLPWTKKDRVPYTLELPLAGNRLKELLSCKQTQTTFHRKGKSCMKSFPDSTTKP